MFNLIMYREEYRTQHEAEADGAVQTVVIDEAAYNDCMQVIEAVCETLGQSINHSVSLVRG